MNELKATGLADVLMVILSQVSELVDSFKVILNQVLGLVNALEGDFEPILEMG